MPLRTQTEIELEAARQQIAFMEQELAARRRLMRSEGCVLLTDNFDVIAREMYEVWHDTLSPQRKIDNRPWEHLGYIRRRLYLDHAEAAWGWRRRKADAPEMIWRLFREGAEWCALIGSIAHGDVCGFGGSASSAMDGLDKAISQYLKNSGDA